MLHPVEISRNSTTESSQSEDEHDAGISRGADANTVNDPDDTFVSPDHNVAVLNISLQGIGESPVVKRKIDTRVNYVRMKVKSIHSKVSRQLELIAGPLSDDAIHSDGGSDSEIIEQLKEKFSSCTLEKRKGASFDGSSQKLEFK